MPPLAKLNVALDDSSLVVTSMISSPAKTAGDDVGRGEFARYEHIVLEAKARDFIESIALEHADQVAGMNGEAINAPRVGEGMNLYRISLIVAELLDEQRHGSRRRALQRQLYFDLIGPGGLPIHLQLLASRVLQHDGINATHAVRLKMYRVLASDNQPGFIAC